MRKRKQEQSEQVTISYETNIDIGLTDKQVEERMEKGQRNLVSTNTSKTTGEIIRSNIFTYFNFIFFLIALALVYERSFNNLTFLGAVVANTIIGIVQELKAKRELESLTLISSPETTVIRDGKQQRLPSNQLVLDDVVVFEAGNQICADAIVCDGVLTINESLVTGEPDEIRKAAGDHILSGSFVISGRAKARLEKVGDESFAAQISKNAKQIKKKQQPGMMKSLTRLIQIIGILVIPLAGLMFWNQHFILGLSEKVSVENAAASIIGMIPEGLYLLTSIALAASTIRLAKRQTLVHDMKCIETLARVDVICVDKTGTITEPQMQVGEILPLMENPTEEQYKKPLGDFVHCMNPDNETMKALHNYFKEQFSYRKAMQVKGFSSATKYSAIDYGGGEAYVLGAPEFILPQMDPSLRSTVTEYSCQGERVLLFAAYRFEKDGADDIFQNGDLGADVTPLALVILLNPIRLEAPKTFGYFTEQGVQIKVISGDNPLTAAMAAKQAGIPNAEKYIDASSLDGKDAISKAAQEYTVFGRVTPEQKRLLIRAMKKAGHTVAMTGDGVNDVLALKDADCSVAMASGSEAAASVSDLVLLDSDFSGMPQVVMEGRRVINNIQRSASLFLVKNIFSFILTLISLFSASLYPLKPAQLALTAAVMIGIPSFFLALEPNEELVKGKFLRNVLYRAFPAALTAVILVEWSLLFAEAFQIGAEQASTVAFYLYTAAAYIMLFQVCKPINVWRGILFGLMGAAFFAAILIIPNWFHIVPLDFGCLLILLALGLLAIPVDHTIRMLFSYCDKGLHHLLERLKSIRIRGSRENI